MAENTRTVYAVSSLRQYQDNEEYFGTDGVFENIEDAISYIRRDMDTTLNDWQAYIAATEALSGEQPNVDYHYYNIDVDGNHFKWQIDVIHTNIR